MAYVDWIKIEHTTPRKEEVIRIAGILKINPYEVVGRLIELWIWADQNTKNGTTFVGHLSAIDHLTGKEGFGQAMMDAGWIKMSTNGFEFPNFLRHNGKSAKKRSEDARKKKYHRTNVPSEEGQMSLPDSTFQGTPSSSPSMSLGDKSKEEENRGGAGGEDAAADLAREYWFLIPGMRKPMVDDLTPQFAEKLRVYGKDKIAVIRKHIKSETRDRTEPIWEFWKGCGLSDSPKQAKQKEPYYPSPDEIEKRSLRLAALPHYTAEQRKNMTQEELHADQQAYAAAYRGD